MSIKKRAKDMWVSKLLDRIEKLEEENEKLKSDLAFERSMLDNVKAEYESSQNVIKKLKEKLDWLEFEEWLYD